MVFEKSEYLARIARARAAMERAGIEVRVESDPANPTWLTGYDGWSFYNPQAIVLALDGEPLGPLEEVERVAPDPHEGHGEHPGPPTPPAPVSHAYGRCSHKATTVWELIKPMSSITLGLREKVPGPRS